MDFKAILRTFLKIILPLAFGCLLLWYLYSKMDIGEIWNVIRKGVRYEIILFSLLFGLGANIIRGLRWGLLIRSLGDKVKTGNVIYADDLVEQFGVDAVRYYMLHEMPFANDGVFTYELMIERTNSDLANILGNLVNRTIAMDHKYFDGKIMAPTAAEPVDEELKAVALAMPAKVEKKMDGLHVADAID